MTSAVALAAPHHAARVLTSAMLAGFGRTLVVAPHPDDESLGCGGLIALLCAARQRVSALLVSDGTQSHPRSLRFPAAARRALRDAEWQAALACLGVPAEQLQRLHLPDGAVPGPGDPRFADALARSRAVLAHCAVRTLLLPWRRDPHPDHRATHALLRAALGAGSGIRVLEYPVWTRERGAPDDLPRADEVRCWQLDISMVLAAKRCAIACHRTQLGQVIDDDPQGFTIAPAMRARAESPVEFFYEG